MSLHASILTEILTEGFFEKLLFTEIYKTHNKLKDAFLSLCKVLLIHFQVKVCSKSVHKDGPKSSRTCVRHPKVVRYIYQSKG